jgi:hypothetical protein
MKTKLDETNEVIDKIVRMEEDAKGHIDSVYVMSVMSMDIAVSLASIADSLATLANDKEVGA